MKKIAAALIGIPVLAAVLLVSVPARANDDDTAAMYNTKCKMCHGATAEKKMDKTKADDALIQIVLDGKAAEKPPTCRRSRRRELLPIRQRHWSIT